MADIKISDELYEKLKKQLDENEFKTVDEFVEFILSEIVSKESEQYSEEEEAKIKERLKSLGYL